MTKRTATTAFIVVMLLAALVPPAAAQLTPYRVLDNVEGPWININNVPTRPLLLGTGEDFLYVVNCHDSTVERFSTSQGSGTPTIWDVPWNPVAIGEWLNPATSRYELIVVCRGNYCLVRMSRANGRILGLVELPPGPADVLVDPDRDVAFVSCADADSVVEVDLTTDSILRTYSENLTANFRMKQPTFLSFQEVAGDDRRVLVAPLLSGNNSTPVGPSTQPNATGSVANLDGIDHELPDEDLFVIDPNPDTPGDHVTVVAKDMGTVLFGHGIHPETGRLWQLNTDHDNKNPLRQTEPAIEGKFANNRITIIELPAAGAAPADGEDGPNSDVIILDSYEINPPQGGGTNILPGVTDANTVGQPYTFAVRPSDGHVFVSGLLTDNILVIDEDATSVVSEIDLPEGSIPRGLAFDGFDLYVYCWGNNEVIVYDTTLLSLPLLSQTWHLSHDPAPQQIRDGRREFYNAEFSEHGNLSCATCHVEGGTDMLSWNLSAGFRDGQTTTFLDDKGPMFTQTLKSLEILTPFHWRGERLMGDFEGAFHELLGHDQDVSDEFVDIAAFIFSMSVPANPFQNENRLIDESIVPPLPPGADTNTSAAFGQTKYLTELIAVNANFTCQQCHALPYGTNNNIFPDFTTIKQPRRAYFKVAPFHDMPQKFQTRVLIGRASSPDERGYLGASVAHTGQVPDLFGFVAAIPNNPALDPLVDDITAFVHQLDSGLAPAVHGSAFLDGGASGATLATINWLHAQATGGHCDIVVFGRITAGPTQLDVRWAYDRPSDTFVADRASLAPRTLSDFLSAAGSENNTFVGLPVGSGRRFGIDSDMDGFLNEDDGDDHQVDMTPGDSTPPSMVAGSQRVLFVTNTLARLAWETNEPATSTLEYRKLGTTAWSQREFRELATARSVVLDGLLPSNDTKYPAQSTNPIVPIERSQYQWRVIVTDRNGNSATHDGPGLITTTSVVNFPTSANEDINHGTHIVTGTVMAPLSLVGAGTYSSTVTVDVEYKRGGAPADGRVVVGRLLVKQAGTDKWVHDPMTFPVLPLGATEQAAEAKLSLGTPLDVPGPFLFSPVTIAGQTLLEFQIGGLSTGDEVLFNVESVVEITGGAPSALMNPSTRAFLQWSFAESGEAPTRGIAEVP